MTRRLPAALAWFRHRVRGRPHLGLVDPARPEAPFLDVGAIDELALLATDLLDAPRLAELAHAAAPLRGDPDFDVPVARPGKILCLGKNYAAHAAEFGAPVPEEPVFFNKLPESLVAHRAAVVRPHWLTTRVDHEVELAVVLGFADPDGQGRKYVRPSRALELVAGYTVLNDVTARRLQGDDREAKKPWLRCKSFDTFCPLGPWVVPARSLPNVGDVGIRRAVNGEVRQESRTSRMVVGVADAIAYLSRHTRLRPGDVIGMGTPEGVGPIQSGDVMVGAIDGIGELVNEVRREAAPAP